MGFIQDSISHYIWDIKYRYRENNQIQDQRIEDTWQRVAHAIAAVEKKNSRKHWEKTFYNLLSDFQFLPGGRILAGAGTQHDVTFFNCFVMPILEDALPAIFDGLKEGALTLQQGGGVGYDFSPLRPKGFPVIKTGSQASGPISFMKIWNAMCATMQSTGARRGAMMGLLRCNHPDIEEFITYKKNPHELRHFNISVLVTDDFIDAIREDLNWPLVFDGKVIKVIKAKKLWNELIQSAYECAEPGVIFIDTVNKHNNLWYAENITATNPCGEIPLPSYGACNLGALNLTQFVENPFTEKAEINWKQLEVSTQIATRFLDNVIEVSRYPLSLQEKEEKETRRIGLGITGLGSALIMLGLDYASEKALHTARRIMQSVSVTTWQTSIALAEERGSFPKFEMKKYLQGVFVQSLPAEVQQDIAKKGIRNSHHNTIAPSGTISLLANNVSNGIEPIFSLSYERTVRNIDGSLQKFVVKDYVLHAWEKMNMRQKFPPAWRDSQTLHPMDHLKMQAALQPFIDHAISKTINIPQDFPFKEVQDIYTQAYEFGLKGCTIFRPNPITGSVLKLADYDDEIGQCCVT